MYGFLSRCLKAGSLSVLVPALGCGASDRSISRIPAGRDFDTSWDDSGRSAKVEVAGGSAERILLKNGLIVDGTGSKAYFGDLLIHGAEIELVAGQDLQFAGRTIDCAGSYSILEHVLEMMRHPASMPRAAPLSQS